MKITKRIFLLIDILIVFITFETLYYLKYGYFSQKDIYLLLFLVNTILWVVLSFYQNKYDLIYSYSYNRFLKSIIWSSSLTLFFTTSIISITDLITVSRSFIIKLNLFPLLIESFTIYIIRLFGKKKIELKDEPSKDLKSPNQLESKPRQLLISAAILFIIYFIMIRIKTGDIYIYPWSERILLIIFTAWLLSAVLTKKYSEFNTNNIFFLISPFIKSSLVMIVIATMTYFFFRIEDLSRFLLFGTILTFVVLEIIFYLIYFISKQNRYNDQSGLTQNIINTQWELEDYAEKDTIIESNSEIDIRTIFNQLSSLKSKEKIINFLDSSLDKNYINYLSTTIYSTITIDNIEILRDKSKDLIINLHKLNDIRSINEYLIKCHSKLLTDKFLVGNILPIDTSYSHIQSQMPKLVFSIYYPFYFLFHRIFSKLPRIENFYYFITKGKNRAISKAEIFGRLNYCGFRIINEDIIDNKLFFIAKKVKSVSNITNPSFRPIVKLPRIGHNGEIIYIHKFRTMHPYSEFIQKDVYEANELDIKGKFKYDFRITSWGKVMRKFWLDELPQLYDWIQGRLNLVGVRAISEHYFSLYPKEHQEFRIKFKPGIIPPYYVDLPESLDEIVESEERYLKDKTKAPFRTDIKYAFKAFFNIIFKGARSS